MSEMEEEKLLDDVEVSAEPDVEEPQAAESTDADATPHSARWSAKCNR